jgi:putative ABC transport system permease protein
MIEIFRNMWRRKFRTFLTISGIVIGIFAFTVMGSMALKLNKMIDGGKKYITGQISISPKGTSYESGSGGATLPIDTLNKIGQVEGVDKVGALVSLAVKEPDPDNASFSMGVPPTIYGMEFGSEFKNRNWENMDVKEGAMVGPGDTSDMIAVGINIATDKNLHAGDIYNIRGRDFKVKGVLEKTMTGPDDYVFMDITPAREMLVESNPFLKSLKEQSDKAANITDAALARLPLETRQQLQQAKSFKLEDINSMAGVSWKDGADSEKVAQAIKDQFGDTVTVMSPQKMGEQIDKASATMNAIILGSALLALVVGLFSIVNTMIMSISERTKEIGIKKAIGASPSSIAFEYTLEAGIIGLLGGGVGMGLGALAANIINQKMASKGAEIFLLEPSFLITVVVFSFVVGIIAGIIPAIRASRLNVVDATREL